MARGGGLGPYSGKSGLGFFVAHTVYFDSNQGFATNSICVLVRLYT